MTHARIRDRLPSRRQRLALLMVVPGLSILAIPAIRDSVLYLAGGDHQALSSLVAPLGPAAPLAAIALNVAQAVLAPIPGTAIVFLDGALFGGWGGAIVNWLGGIAGALACFGLAGAFARPLVTRLAGRSERLSSLIVRLEAPADDRSAGGVICLARLLPGSPFDLISYASGLSAVRTWPFLWGTAVGSAPHALAYAALGASLSVPLWAGMAATGALTAAMADAAVLVRRGRRSATAPAAAAA